MIFSPAIGIFLVYLVSLIRPGLLNMPSRTWYHAAISTMLIDLSLAVGSLIAMNAGVKPEYALPALGVFILSDTFLGILSYVNTAGGDESFVGKGISPANP